MEPALLNSQCAQPLPGATAPQRQVSPQIAALIKKIGDATALLDATVKAGNSSEGSNLAVQIGDLWYSGNNGASIGKAWKCYKNALALNPYNELALNKLNQAAAELKRLGVGTYMGIKVIPLPE